MKKILNDEYGINQDIRVELKEVHEDDMLKIEKLFL